MEDRPMNPTFTDLPLGAHVVTPRKGYSHHGIYVGNGRVAHYAGYWQMGRRGPVELIALADFACGAGFWIEPARDARFSGVEIAARALARIGENRYSVIHNNCEHFCAWCMTGVPQSPQIEWLLAHPRRALGTVVRAVCNVLAARVGFGRTVSSGLTT
jgi:Lecithin retinol acyltransferase